MSPSHVPPDHLPLQGQPIYSDPAYENLFPADQYAAQSWNGQLGHHAGLVASHPGNQSWQHSSFPQQPYSAISQSYATQGPGYRTASPYQYNQFGSHGAMSSYSHAANVDPSLGVDPNSTRQQQQSPYPMGGQNAQTHGQSNTVTSQTLPQNLAVQNSRPSSSSFQIPKTTSEAFAQRTVPPVIAKPAKNPEYDIPKGRKSGGFFVFDQAALAKATKSIALNKLVTLGSEPFHFPSNRTALPLYTPRQSVKDLKKAGADNKKLLAKKSPTKSLSAGRPLKHESSDSESSDESSDDDSEYTDDEEVEQSPLPAARPEEPHAAVRYDIIKAAWYPRKSKPSPEKVKASLQNMWEVISTIHKRWRIDSKAVTEAEEQKRTGELPLLKSRVTDGRNLLQSAIKAALEFGHPDVLFNFGKVKNFLYACYQFLANRVKVQDFDGELPAAIFEMLARCVGTLTTELLEETKLIKALNSFKKNGNGKIKAIIQQIIEGAAAGSKKAKAGSPPDIDATAESKTVKRPTTQPLTRSATEVSAIKKSKPIDLTSADKKTGTTTLAQKTASSTGTTQQKRPGEKTAPAPAKARGNQVVNKPSTLFASLNAASKKPAASSASTSSIKPAAKPAVVAAKDKKPTPTPAAKPAFSFAETMAQLMKPKEEEVAAPSKTEKQLPPETAEEKAKRLRKESRRHLRVTFRPDASLVSIKYFHHHPEEESGHDENFVRDAGDVGGEGRMFKQHKEMMDDDDDDEAEVEYRPWKDPTLIDFSVVDAKTRQDNYEPYGGGESKPTCPEKEANIRHENSTLMVFYTHPSDIPTSPREPLESQTQPSPSASVTHFGAPPETVLNRAPAPPTSAAPEDFSNLENIFRQFSTPPAGTSQASAGQSNYTPPPPAPPAPAPAQDLASILNALGQGQGQIPPQPSVPFPAVQPPAAVPAVDLNAIMAAIASASNQGFPQAAPNAGWSALPTTYPQQQQQQQQPPPQQPEASVSFHTQSQPQHSHHTRSGHKRQREDGNDGNDKNHGSTKRNRGDKGGDRGSNRPHKVVPCRFYQKGLCNKGAECTYIHPQD